MTVPCDGLPVEHRVTGRLDLPGDEAAFVATDLVYAPDDCLAVTMMLRGPDGQSVEWTFGWELLASGLDEPTGEGDVRVRPLPGGPPLVEVALGGPFGARIIFAAEDIEPFVRGVRAVAPGDLGRITADLEAELAAIAADG